MTRTKMELIPTMGIPTRLLEELCERMLPIRKGVPTLRRHGVVRVFPVVEALAQFYKEGECVDDTIGEGRRNSYRGF